VISLPMFFCANCDRLHVNFLKFLYFPKLGLESGHQIGYNGAVYA
jgi:hypothetical protein